METATQQPCYMTYSVVIRTLHGGEKYGKLLESIARQSVAPRHIYVVLPNGYEPPAESLGVEEYIYTNKGMWNQRIYGLEYPAIHNDDAEYLLVCDDDIAFSQDFAARLTKIAADNRADILCPLGDLSCPLLHRLIFSAIGNRHESSRSRFRVAITRCGGHTVNNDASDNVMPTQSGIFQCFIMRSDSVCRLAPREEMWLDRTPYAFLDDQVFFYKAYCKGLNILSCRQPEFTHLDARSNSDPKVRARNLAFSIASNSLIFWHRFIYRRSSGLFPHIVDTAAISYKTLMNFIFFSAYGILQGDIKRCIAYLNGVIKALRFIKSPEYKRLPAVITPDYPT